MRHLLLILFLAIAMFSCKNEGSSSLNENATVDATPPVDPSKLTIPSSCSLISATEVKSIFGAKADIRVKDATDPSNKFSKACFFQWDDADSPNSGIMIQVQTNSVYGEYAEYIKNYIASKLENGEMEMGNDKPMKYTKFNAGGRPGAYNFNQGRFYWTTDNNYLITLYFNVTSLNEKGMVRAAEKIVEKVNSNFAKAVKN